MGLGLLLLAVLSAVSSPTQAAQAEITCTGNAETITITMPASITVPRDAAIGTVLSPWVSSAANQSFYQCQGTIGAEGVPASGIVFQPISLARSEVSVTDANAIPFTVWNTNVPGIGLAVRIRAFANGCSWAGPLDLGTPGGWIESPWTGNACNSVNPPIANGGQVQVALVKTGRVKAGSVVAPQIVAEAAYTTKAKPHDQFIVAASDRKTFVTSSTTINVPVCSTTSVPVNLGTHKQSRFTSIGSTTPTVAFKIDLIGCPTEMNVINYQFIPVTTVLDDSNGVLALLPDSTATGIGVQLKDGNGTPLKYNTPYPLTGYDKAKGGSYTIPLTASYYQTSNAVEPGSANSLLTFTMSYQ